MAAVVEFLDRVLPVITLLLGAGVARVGKKSEWRHRAAEELAEIDRHVWKKGGEDDFIDLQVYLGRLTVGLRKAGVPWTLVRGVRDAAVVAWTNVRQEEDGTWGIDPRAALRVDLVRDCVLDWLDRPWHLHRRWRAWRRGRDLPTELAKMLPPPSQPSL